MLQCVYAMPFSDWINVMRQMVVIYATISALKKQVLLYGVMTCLVIRYSLKKTHPELSHTPTVFMMLSVVKGEAEMVPLCADLTT